jgi:hypothetical protein
LKPQRNVAYQAVHPHPLLITPQTFRESAVFVRAFIARSDFIQQEMEDFIAQPLTSATAALVKYGAEVYLRYGVWR